MDRLPLGPFAVGPDGVLHLRHAEARPAMRFAWRGRGCEAELLPDRGALRLAAVAARIPSTAEPGADRARAFAALSGLPPPGLPGGGGWRLRLLPDHRVRVEAQAALPGPATAMVAAMVRFALALDPYLDRLEAAGAGWSGGATAEPAEAGSAKICPG